MAQQTTVPAADRLVRYAAVFLPAALPRDGRIAFWDPEGVAPAPLPTGRRATAGIRRTPSRS